jgi:hypothetical protein
VSIKDEARAESERRWPIDPEVDDGRVIAALANCQAGFQLGAQWASEQADREPSERHDSTENGSVVPPSDAYVTALAREFEHIWNERVETFDPEVHDATPFIECIMRDALLAVQEVRDAD